MRTGLVVALLSHVPLMAAPVPVAPAPLTPEARKQLQTEAMVFAQQLLSVSTQVSVGYIKDVSHADLLVAAVNGLHDALRQPGPSGLRGDPRPALVAERSQTLRPDNDLKLLPLDDFAMDPQRQHALEWSVY